MRATLSLLAVAGVVVVPDDLTTVLARLGDDGGSLIGGLIVLVAVAITSLRRRRDTTIEELEARVASLEQKVRDLTSEHETEVARLEADRDAAHDRAEVHKLANVTARSQLHKIRLVLADHGLDDPTSL